MRKRVLSNKTKEELIDIILSLEKSIVKVSIIQIVFIASITWLLLQR